MMVASIIDLEIGTVPPRAFLTRPACKDSRFFSFSPVDVVVFARSEDGETTLVESNFKFSLRRFTAQPKQQSMTMTAAAIRIGTIVRRCLRGDDVVEAMLGESIE